jgi:hypothetical protein
VSRLEREIHVKMVEPGHPWLYRAVAAMEFCHSKLEQSGYCKEVATLVYYAGSTEVLGVHILLRIESMKD